MHASESPADLTADREIVITRVYDAPARLLFEAYSRPEHIKRWFGPVTWPLTKAEMDFRVGGEFHFQMSLPAVSKHLKVLERAGLISRGREAQWRPCRLEAEAMKEVADWLDEYRRFWEGSLDRLDDYLAEMQKEER